MGPPTILKHPVSQSAPAGAEATLKVEARGDELTFQWQKDRIDVHNDSTYSGTDTNTLRIKHVKKSDEGHYRCVVKNEVKKEGELSEETHFTVCECLSLICYLHCIVFEHDCYSRPWAFFQTIWLSPFNYVLLDYNGCLFTLKVW